MAYSPNTTGGSSNRQRRESSGANEGHLGWNLSSTDGGADAAKEEELRRLREENGILRHRVEEVEGNWRKAVESAKGFQEAQQRLFQDLVLLREKYDDAKAHIAEVRRCQSETPHPPLVCLSVRPRSVREAAP